MTVVTSLQNPRVKALVRLQDKPAERRAEGLVVIEGDKEIGYALAAGLVVRELWVCPALRAQASRPWPAGLGGERVEVSREVFAKIAYRDDSDGLVVVAEAPARSLAAVPAWSAPPLVLVVDAVEKPGNLGAILRTADGVGADLVLVCDPRADLFSPNVIRASVGTVFTTPAVPCTAEAARAFLAERGVALVAVTPDGAADLWSPEVGRALVGPIALCLGAEHAGLDPAWVAAASLRVAIPMRGRNDSLNVSVAAAILAYEALRVRRASLDGGPPR